MTDVRTGGESHARTPDAPGPVSATLREELSLGAHVHVWQLALRPARHFVDDTSSIAWLDAAERRRADRFLVAEARACYLQCRIALRTLLGGYLGRSPAEVYIDVAPHGKPTLTQAAESWLCFNVSHSHERALVAVASRRQVGIDVEHIRPDLDHEEMAVHHFAPEERAALARLPAAERCDAFFWYWTRKEAYLKATGDGLMTPLDSFHIVPAAAHAPVHVTVAGQPHASQRWSFHDVPLPRDYAGALVVEGPAHVRMLEFPVIRSP